MSRRSERCVVRWILVLMVLLLTFTSMSMIAYASEGDLNAAEDQHLEVENRDQTTPKIEEALPAQPVPAPMAHSDADDSQSATAPISAHVGDDEGTPVKPTDYTDDQDANTQPDPTAIADDEIVTPQPESTEATDELGAEDRPAEYTVRFLNADDTLFFRIMLGEGEPITKPRTDPSLDGYEFEYWYTVHNGEKKPFSSGALATDDITYKAFFTRTEVTVQTPEEALEDASTETGAQLIEEEEVPGTIEIEDEQTPLGLGTLDPAPCAVHVSSDWGEVVEEGDVITLTGKLIGFDSQDVELQWQFNDGDDWKDSQNANGLTYSFAANKQTIQYRWRLMVSI